MYRIYLISDTDCVEWSSIEPYISFLPHDRRKKAQHFRRVIDRKNCILSYLLLQYGVYKIYGISSFSLSYGKNMKPYLSDLPHIHFNISHCDSACICAIADEPIGIDIQDIRPISWTVVNHCCSNEEKQWLKDCSDLAAEFTKIWTMKESYLKMKGTGITDDLCSVDTTKLCDKIKTFEINNCYISVASAESFTEEERCLI